MPDPILILCGLEEGPYLEAKLRASASDVLIATCHDAIELEKTSHQSFFLQADRPRLIAFCTDVIVPSAVLKIFKGGAYNFHPASPDYPGSNAASFAIYDQVQKYGVTAHVMEATVDSGKIVSFSEFDVPDGVRFMDLEILAYQNLLNLFDQLVPELVNTDVDLAALDIQWGQNKRTRKDFDRMRAVTEDMSEEEIRLRWRAFG